MHRARKQVNLTLRAEHSEDRRQPDQLRPRDGPRGWEAQVRAEWRRLAGQRAARRPGAALSGPDPPSSSSGRLHDQPLLFEPGLHPASQEIQKGDEHM